MLMSKFVLIFVFIALLSFIQLWIKQYRIAQNICEMNVEIYDSNIPEYPRNKAEVLPMWQ